MKTKLLLGICFCILLMLFSFNTKENTNEYTTLYFNNLKNLTHANNHLLHQIKSTTSFSEDEKKRTQLTIDSIRIQLKAMDFWLRYLEPINYKLINGPLPVEWETEVFEKFEAPYKREGAGLTLASIYLQEEDFQKDSLYKLIEKGTKALNVFQQDSITIHLNTPHHFFLCNRLYLLNLAAIYTTGFENPTTERIIPELEEMLKAVEAIYKTFNNTFETKIINSYSNLYSKTIAFVKNQPKNIEAFDHFTFIKNYINPLFALNQKMINENNVVSKSYVDYSLNKSTTSIFSKNLYHGQNTKGLFIRINDKVVLNELNELGKKLFYDPILSGNNERSCASCHIASQFFTDTSQTASLQFNKKDLLPRNTPSLINSQYNHLLMLDGFHISLQNQAKSVITNSVEMNCSENEILKKVLSCKEYKQRLTSLLKHTPQEKEITIEHISSALTFYYSKFSNYYAPFDRAMNNSEVINDEVKKGFNVFMSKAQCATCHFLPQFNGVKPPYVGSEFEVLGVPADTSFKTLSKDRGRYEVTPAKETMHAFRTGTLKNIMKTKPYMHNGVFNNMNEVIEFYNRGGGAGRGLNVPNQTLASDSLHLTNNEKKWLIAFIQSLNEDVIFEPLPENLPLSKIKKLNIRKVGGNY